MPHTMEEVPLRMSAANRTAQFIRGVPYSERYIPPSTPTGMPTNPANPSKVALPRMALAIPPPGVAVGLGNWVKKFRSSELAPFCSRLKSTRASGAITTAAHSRHRPETQALLIFLHR